MAQIDINKLIGETTEYDKKLMLEERRPKSWLKSVSAFANCEGGTLIFGVSDEGEIIGLKNFQHDSEVISEQIKTKMDPVPEVNLKFHQTDDGKTLILLQVKKGSETPYFYNADGSRIAFVRIGNESVQADALMLKRLVLKGFKHSFDSQPSQYKFERMSFTKLKSICFQRTHTDFLDSDYASWGLLDTDGNLTNAGALLADECPIRYSRVFCTRWNGNGKAGGLIDALDDAEYSGSLLILLQEMIGFINRNNRKAWKKLATSRLEMPDYPDRAITEACVNALIHRDYLDYSSEIHVDMYDDRLEIYSPGGMVDGTLVQNLNPMNIISKRRNPIIADIFSRLKLMERRGSGFKKIIEDYSNFSASKEQKPTFRSDAHSFFIVLPNLNYGISENEYVDADSKKDNVTKDVTKRQAEILSLIKKNPTINQNNMATELGVTKRTIARDINALKEKGIIDREGDDKRGRWIIKNIKIDDH